MNRILLIVLIIMISYTSLLADVNNQDEKALVDSIKQVEKIDDWQLDLNMPEIAISPIKIKQASSGKTAGAEEKLILDTIGATNLDIFYESVPSRSMTSPHQNLGFSVGGAKDVSNFRLNIENGYLPQANSITYEGLFYDYYFDTSGISSETDDLFSPSYNFVRERNLLTDEEETWLSVGLNSNLKESDFKRKKLNLVVVLDISGSMNSGFDKYYYDKAGGKKENDNRSKLEIATETICSMLDHLNSDDRFGMVLFERKSFLAKPLNLVCETDMAKIKEHIKALQTQGGTNMYAGMQSGTQLFEKHLNVNKDEYENRIIFLTDAMPNRGLTDKNSLWGVLDDNADKGLYASIIGIGVDFQTLLIEHISKVEGANYYSVHSAKDFEKRLDEEFEFMVTPMVFNLNMVIDAEGYEIKRVCGTPYSDDSNGEIMKVGTLFPSASEDGEVKGGIILVELKETAEGGEIYLMAGYDDRNGKHFQNRVNVDFREIMLSSTISRGLQKGVLLVHYTDLLQEWVEFMRDPDGGEQNKGIDDWQYNKHHNRRRQSELNEWEQFSMPLSVNDHYRGEFRKFKELLLRETQRLDEHLQQEVDLLELLINLDEIEIDYEEVYYKNSIGKTPKGFIYYDDPPLQVNEPVLIYPKFAKDAGIQGTVKLEIEILINGKVGAIDVIKSILPGPGGLDEAAIEYARRLQFEPAMTNGKPVAVWVTIPVEFYLD